METVLKKCFGMILECYSSPFTGVSIIVVYFLVIFTGC